MAAYSDLNPLRPAHRDTTLTSLGTIQILQFLGSSQSITGLPQTPQCSLVYVPHSTAPTSPRALSHSITALSGHCHWVPGMAFSARATSLVLRGKRSPWYGSSCTWITTTPVEESAGCPRSVASTKSVRWR